MLSKDELDKLIKINKVYYLRNSDGTFYKVDPYDYKKIETEVFLLKYIELFLPDFDYLYDELDYIFRKNRIDYNPLAGALNEINLNNRNLEEYYKIIKIGLYVDSDYHISIGSKNSDIKFNNKRLNPKKFIRTLKVYKEMLQNYCQRHNNELSIKYKEYIKMIEEGRIPLLFSYNNKDILTDLINYSNILNKNCYRDISDYTSNKLYSGFYNSYFIKYYDENGNRYEIPASNATHLKEMMTYLAKAIDDCVEEKGFKKYKIKK